MSLEHKIVINFQKTNIFQLTEAINLFSLLYCSIQEAIEDRFFRVNKHRKNR